MKMLLLLLFLSSTASIAPAAPVEMDLHKGCVNSSLRYLKGSITNNTNRTLHVQLSYVGVNSQGEQLPGTEVLIYPVIAPHRKARIYEVCLFGSCDTIKDFILVEDNTWIEN